MTMPNITPLPQISPLNAQYYERYNPTAFNDSLTILEKLNKVIYQLNNLGKISNDLYTQWNELVKWFFDNGLNDVVSEEINKKIDDGTFNDLFGKLLGDLTDLKTLDKKTIVAAINEINDIALTNKNNIGDMDSLITNNVDTLVDAINELKSESIQNGQVVLSLGESTGQGVITGLKVTQQPVLAMAVNIGDNVVENIVHLKNGERYTPKSVALPIENSHPTLNRIDMIYVNHLGVISYLKGQETVSPVAPTLGFMDVPLAEIIVQSKDTTINNVDIVDRRPLKGLQFLKTNNKYNLVEAINEVLTSLSDVINKEVGGLENLLTDDKTNLVNAINETFNKMATKIMIGSLNDLITNDKTNIVNAVNSGVSEIKELIGNMSSLKTSHKDTLVGAINEVIDNTYDLIADIENNVGDVSQLNTTVKNSIVEAINEVLKELNDKIGNLVLLNTTDKTSIVNAINEVINNTYDLIESVMNDVGEIAKLETTDKTNIVNAINEVLKKYTESNTEILNIVGDIAALKTINKDTIVDSINEVVDSVDVVNESVEEVNKRVKSIEDLFVNVKDFGATGLGLTDDSVSIQKAINSIASGVVFIPPGTYLIEEQRLTVKTNITLMGSGEGITILKRPNNSEKYDSMVGIEALENSNIVMMNFSINGNKLNQTKESYGILAYKSSFATFKNITIYDTFGIGLGFSTCSDMKVDNVSILRTGKNKPAFWMSEGYGRHVFENCKAIESDLDGMIVNEDYITVRNSVFNNNGVGTEFDGALGAGGIYSDLHVYNLTIENVTANENSEYGLNLRARNSMIINCDCYKNGLSGINIGVDSFRIGVMGCKTIDNGKSRTTANPTLWSKSGISFDGVTFLSILNCFSYDNNGTSQVYGIEFLNQSLSKNIIIKNNFLKYNKTDDSNIYLDNPHPNLEDIIMKDNY